MEQGTTVAEKPPVAKPQTTAELSAPTSKKRGRPPKQKVKEKLKDLVNTVGQELIDKDSADIIKKLKDALTPFAKIPFDDGKQPNDVLYRLARGNSTAEIKNGDILTARKILGLS